MTLSTTHIINETANYYNLNPKMRAYNEKLDRCEYQTSDGRNCALGRCMIDPNEVSNVGPRNLAKECEGEGFDELLKPEYHGHSIDFWDDLQNFHDNQENWTTDGMSAQGQSRLRLLHDRWSV